MQRATTNARMDGRRRGILKVFAAAAAILVVIAIDGDLSNVSAQQQPGPASDQHTPASQSTARLRFEAPIGHRQPRPSDLPASVLHDEGSPHSGDAVIDPDLRICRDC
jgi:hypothetical protein